MEDMERSASRRRSRGFTLTEMLAGIAMLAILAGLLIPISAAMYRRFRLTEMDDFARQICVAAQNELTAMKASGRLEVFARQVDRRLAQQPQDYPEGDTDGWKDLFAVYSTDQAAEVFSCTPATPSARPPNTGAISSWSSTPSPGTCTAPFIPSSPSPMSRSVPGGPEQGDPAGGEGPHRLLQRRLGRLWRRWRSGEVLPHHRANQRGRAVCEDRLRRFDGPAPHPAEPDRDPDGEGRERGRGAVHLSGRNGLLCGARQHHAL